MATQKEPAGEPVSGKLKEIGNRIAHLTWREIRALACLIDPSAGAAERDEMVGRLLTASDEIARRPTIEREPEIKLDIPPRGRCA